MNVKPILFGIATYVPGIYRLFSKTGGTNSAKYCYSIWLRHLVLAHQHGLTTTIPKIVAELGPGDSLGIGLAALLSGAEKYYALDVVRYAGMGRNLAIFDQLVDLFQQRANIPGDDEVPLYNLRLESYQFPSTILTDTHLEHALTAKRIQAIRDALLRAGSQAGQAKCISYIVPWYGSSVITKSSVDMIYSQAVLEHVDNLEVTYRALAEWLKAGGFMSHAIDFDCHGTAEKWNGHWHYSERVWKLIRGRRAYLINRQPHSTHIDLLRRNGFDVVYDKKRTDRSGISREQLTSRFNVLSDDDLVTRSALIQARKKSY